MSSTQIIDRAGAYDEPYEYARSHEPKGGHYPKKKPKNFLKELLEFD